MRSEQVEAVDQLQMSRPMQTVALTRPMYLTWTCQAEGPMSSEQSTYSIHEQGRTLMVDQLGVSRSGRCRSVSRPVRAASSGDAA
eukprot:scaffold151421_cov27-Tisochrysis_lutea.AAC.1